ncbi:VOC family protein [Kribbella sp. NPDC051587]
MASKLTELAIDCAADVGQGADATWVVLVDPEGNEFCVLAGRHP